MASDFTECQFHIVSKALGLNAFIRLSLARMLTWKHSNSVERFRKPREKNMRIRDDQNLPKGLVTCSNCCNNNNRTKTRII